MSQLSNPFLEVDLPDSEEIYEPTPFGISALTSVDHLMDEVFQDLEQLLVRGAVLPNDLHEEPAPKPVSAAPLLMPSCLTAPPQSAAAAYLSAALANGQMPTHLPTGELPSDALPSGLPNALPNALPDRISPQMLNSHDDLMDDPDLVDLMNLEQITVPPRKSGNGGIVLSAVLGTLLVTGGLYATLRYRLYQMIPGMGTGVTEASVPQSAQSGKDQQFLDYVGRSLNRIDRTATRSGTGTIATAPGTVPSTIPGTVPGTVPPPPDLLTVPSVVTVPPVVGTLPAAQPPVFGSFTNQPGVTLPRTVPGTVPGITAVAPVKASPAARPAARPSAPSATATRPTAVAPVTQAAPSLPVVSPSPIALTPNFDASETHSLIGLLELGDRSAALMAVNGVPQRIQVGEKIGASGWQVMSITSQAAIIQRNNEVRSIYVGQQF
jgi:hypothetical protein